MFGLIAAGFAFFTVLTAMLIYRLLDLELQISAYRDVNAQLKKDMEDFNRANNEEVCSNK